MLDHTATDTLGRLAIELPPWALGASGTRFTAFTKPGTPRTVEEKISDASKMHELPLICSTPAFSTPSSSTAAPGSPDPFS
jgi:L-rhamnose isomerase/sugar isomerase